MQENSNNKIKKEKILNLISICIVITSLITSFILIINIFKIPNWILIYNWELILIEDKILSLLLVIGLIILVIIGFLGLIVSVNFIYQLIKYKKFHISKKLKGIPIATIIILISLIIYLPEINKEINQYKKHNRDQITLITQGYANDALRYSNAYLDYDPTDVEARFIKIVSLTQLNQLDKAYNLFIESQHYGLTIERILAGPRNLLTPFYEYEQFQNLVKSENINLIHGPVLGDIRSDSVKIWVRTLIESNITAIASNYSDFNDPIFSETVVSNSTNDFTATINLNELAENTKYFYKIVINEIDLGYISNQTFTTSPISGEGSIFSIGFGGGAGYTPQHEVMWNILNSHDLHSFLFLGDNVYIDTPEVPETQKYCYYRRQSQPFYHDFSTSTPIFAIWDDHDFGVDDCTSSLSLNNPPWKLDVLEVFKQNFPNPNFGNESVPGVYFNFSIGDVDFFMLDCRFYRQNPKDFSSPTMIGPDQKYWLLNALNKSEATFKVIASSVPWAYNTKPGSLDTWDGFPQEREEIFSFIEHNNINGVLLISADRHRSDAWKIERSNGYPLYDFMSSKLTNVHYHSEMSAALFSYNDKCSFGKLSFNTILMDPEVVYSIYNIDNVNLYNLTLKKSELSF